MAWRSRSKIPARAYIKKTSTVSLMRSSRRKPMAWGWGWQFAGWLSRPMAEHCRYPLSRLMARHFALLCPVLADASNLPLAVHIITPHSATSAFKSLAKFRPGVGRVFLLVLSQHGGTRDRHHLRRVLEK